MRHSPQPSKFQQLAHAHAHHAEHLHHVAPAKHHAPGFQLPAPHSFVKGTWLDHLTHFSYLKPLMIASFVALFTGSFIYYWVKDRANRGDHGGPSGGLNYVVGPMGSGKSMFGVRQIVAALLRGQYVITNVRLLDGWAEQLVKWHYGGDYRDPGRRAAAIAKLEGHYVFERALRTAMRYRVPCVRCGGDTRTCGHVGPDQEGRAVFVWDETHNDLNNRDYQGYGDTREARDAEKERRRIVIRWATQLRKLGFVGFLLSQHHENTDAQLRRVCNHIIRLQNQRQSEGLWLARLLPRRFTVFLVYWYPAHLATGVPEHLIKPIRFDRYLLPRERVLYDSWETFHGVDELDGEDAPILLPAGGLGSSEKAGGAPADAGEPAVPLPALSPAAAGQGDRAPIPRIAAGSVAVVSDGAR
jgi:hypothetical protein